MAYLHKKWLRPWNVLSSGFYVGQSNIDLQISLRIVLQNFICLLFLGWILDRKGCLHCKNIFPSKATKTFFISESFFWKYPTVQCAPMNLFLNHFGALGSISPGQVKWSKCNLIFFGALPWPNSLIFLNFFQLSWRDFAR